MENVWSLKGKRLVLGIGGSIAACKAPQLVSALVKEGVDVYPLLTKTAVHFTTVCSLETLSRHRVWQDSFDEAPEGMIPHIDLAGAAELILVAPASANLIARLAQGLADDMLTAVALAATCPKFIVPAMNTHMLHHPATQKNLAILRDYGWQEMPSVRGMLACGYEGDGKMPEVPAIIRWLQDSCMKKDMEGQRVVVTAGPTRESIDPVRFITNHSTGKMGYALARAALARGAAVTLISGPVQLENPTGSKYIQVETAAEMAAAVRHSMAEADILIMAAAVADYRPLQSSENKLKKKEAQLSLVLERTEDVLAAAAAARRPGQIICGFAMETEALLEHARSKFTRKNLDLICANSLREEGAGFAVDTNVLTLISRDEERSLPQMSKLEAAHCVLDKLMELEAGQKQALAEG